jgi:23S rRNA (cytidine1920-2'-O)/16S rRNA (cytidine1409-2'-O)-methyltransferase
VTKLRADALLVARGLAESRAKARAAIEAGSVTADGQAVAKASELVEETAELVAEAAHPWVGRGALKLVHALDLWGIDVKGTVVLDIGASTGGFTEVCLSRGAAHVYAVDVGRGQLHPKLAGDPRITNMEGTDARAITPDAVALSPGLIVCDASFIGLAKVLPAALSLANTGATLVALIKPQFEVGPDRVGKGGLVKDSNEHARAVSDVSVFLTGSGWTVRATTQSPITGGEGQVEFLVWATRG